MFNQYLLILFWVGFMAILQKYFYRAEGNTLISGRVWRVTPVFAFIVFLPIIWMAGHRGWDGVFDTGLYIRYFWDMPTTFAQLPSYLGTIDKDKGFYALSAVIKILLGANEDVYFTIIAFLQGFCVLKIFRKFSPNYMLSVFLFIASTDYLSGMFNGIRQFTAVALIFAATPWMLKKKYVLVTLCILFASLFHQSAIIMLPIVFIAQGKAWNKKTLGFILAMLAAIMFVGQFTDLLDNALQDTQYSNVVSDYTGFQDDGTNPLRVLVYSIPCILSFFLRKQIRKESNPLIHLCVNMSIVTMGLYVLSMFTSGIFMGRLPIYCNLYCYLLLPWEIEHLFTNQNQKINQNLMSILTVGCYLLFYFYVTHYQYGIV